MHQTYLESLVSVITKQTNTTIENSTCKYILVCYSW